MFMNRKERVEWLESLEVGDQVVVRRSDAKTLVTVSKITPKQIVVGHRRFWKRNGDQVGGGAWNWATLDPATPEVIEEIRDRAERRKLLDAISVFRWEWLETHKLRGVKMFIDEYLAAQKRTG